MHLWEHTAVLCKQGKAKARRVNDTGRRLKALVSFPHL